jgi:hypothetical protein
MTEFPTECLSIVVKTVSGYTDWLIADSEIPAAVSDPEVRFPEHQ